MSKSPEGSVSVVTTCRGRLHHLERSLPRMIAAGFDEIIVVDYSCPQDTGSWVSRHHPKVVVVSVPGRTRFSASSARNHGAAVARGDILFFVDADVLILDEVVAEKLEDQVCRGSAIRANPGIDVSLFGTHAVHRDDFFFVEGYDEAFASWGGEDADLFERLQEANVRFSHFPDNVFKAIPHGDEERNLWSLHSTKYSVISSNLYRQVKRDLTRLTGTKPELDARVRLKESIDKNVKRLANSKNPKLSLKVNLGPMPGFAGRQVSSDRCLVYELQLDEGQDHQS